MFVKESRMNLTPHWRAVRLNPTKGGSNQRWVITGIVFFKRNYALVGLCISPIKGDSMYIKRFSSGTNIFGRIKLSFVARCTHLVKPLLVCPPAWQLPPLPHWYWNQKVSEDEAEYIDDDNQESEDELNWEQQEVMVKRLQNKFPNLDKEVKTKKRQAKIVKYFVTRHIHPSRTVNLFSQPLICLDFEPFFCVTWPLSF